MTVTTRCALFFTVVIYFMSVTDFYRLTHSFCKFVSSRDAKETFKSSASSVWCYNSDGSRMCTFTNLCYSTQERQFVFALSTNSVLNGVFSKDDLKSISLSSVSNHNLFTMKIALISPDDEILKRKQSRHKNVFLLWRFKWDNIMHVLHDDILPLYFTYLHLCKGFVDKCVNDYTLSFIDEGTIGPYADLYRIFSKGEPMLLNKNDPESLVCYDRVQTGLLNYSVWFQYGFGSPQGPSNNTNLHGNMLQTFKYYLMEKLALTPHVDSNSVVFLSRKMNRRILNEDYVLSTLIASTKDLYPTKNPYVINLDLSTHNFTFVLSSLLSSKIVVGMHGSAMILCVLLEPGSAVVEMFPFGISAQNVSPIKAFSNVKGTGLLYRSWENPDEAMSVPHPEAPPLLGGLHHLPEADQQKIKQQKAIPAVECCHNAAYLYRMFQDTFVGTSFKTVYDEALREQAGFSVTEFKKKYSVAIHEQWYYPAPVTNITCTADAEHVVISWNKPINGHDYTMYHVAVQLESQVVQAVETKNLWTSVGREAQHVRHADVWVKAVAMNSESTDAYVRCTIAESR